MIITVKRKKGVYLNKMSGGRVVGREEEALYRDWSEELRYEC
jgi:hypothetical protein